nr:ABC transporter substrate-binding protein [Rhodococcus wratislaviensis]
MPYSRTRLAVVGAAAVVTTALAGCAGTNSGEDPTELKVGLFSSDITFSAFYAGMGEGGALSEVLERRGIELSVETIPSGSNLVAALAGGSVDIAILPGSSVLGVNAQGGALVPLMNMFDGPSQQVIARSALEPTNNTDVATFDGQRWAFTRVGSISEISARLTAEDAGLAWENQQRMPLGSGSETQAVLTSDRADILSTSPANSAEAVESGTAYLVANPQDDDSLPIAHQLNSILTASPRFAQNHPELTQDIVTAVVSELTEISASTSADDVLNKMPQSFKDAVGTTWNRQWEFSQSGFTRATGGFSAEEVAQTVAGAKLVDVVPADYAPEPTTFDNAYVLKAYDLLGAETPAGLA